MPSATAPARVRFKHLADLLDRLGNVPADRICMHPAPGTATKRDLIRLDGNGKLYELVDRTLVEKPMGSPESFLAARLIGRFEMFLDTNDAGFLYAPDALIEVLPNLVRGPDVSFIPWTRRPERTVPTEPISDLIPTLAVEILSPSNTRKEIAPQARRVLPVRRPSRVGDRPGQANRRRLHRPGRQVGRRCPRRR